MSERAEDFDALQDAWEEENHSADDIRDARIQQAIAYLEDNTDLDRPITTEDALEYLGGQCGMQTDGFCTMAGTEECDECIFQEEETA